VYVHLLSRQETVTPYTSSQSLNPWLHALPQAPQFIGSFERSVVQRVVPQLPYGLGHGVSLVAGHIRIVGGAGAASGSDDASGVGVKLPMVAAASGAAASGEAS
jgi:hypothetical protein